MDINNFLDKIKQKFNLESELELASTLNITNQTLKKYRESNKLTEFQMANLFEKAMDARETDSFKKAIKPIVEFYPINFTEARNGIDWKILSSDKKAFPDDYKLKEELDKYIEGIYFFYNSEGKIIYAGKTHSNLWKEINFAFNRDRKSQKMYRVNHDRKNKVLKEVNVKLHDIAHYFSVYETHCNLTHNLEAFIIRAMPNNLTNVRMEKLKI